ncbi:MAG: alpha-keto acid decarboxylase family protein, partial [Corynebacterium casei]
MRTTVGELIIRRLKEMGIEHIIGVPGDFNLSFIEQINEAENIEFVGACNELNAAYAADGYGRQSGVGALLTTYGVGELSALNGIAGARAEHVPMVSLAGSPPLYSTEYRWNLHHSLADGDFENMLESILPFTGAAVRITPMNVVEELDRALHICLREKRPVHIQIPSDITHLEIEAPDEALDTTLPTSDAERLEAATARVLERIAEAKKPVFLFDQDTDRHGFTEKFRTLVDKLQIPYTQLTSGKGVLSERDGLFLGSYNGKASAPGVQKIVESADLLFTTNPRFIEVNSGSFTHHLPAEAIVNFGDQHVNVGGEFFVGINTLELLDALIDRTKTSRNKKKEEFVYDEWEIDAEAPLTHARMWPRFIRFLEDDDTVIAEAGTSHIGLTPERLPKGARYINSPIWGAIGFTLPALLGSMLA